MLSRPELDVYDYIELKLIQIKVDLQDQDPQNKYNYFILFVEELLMFTNKECLKDQVAKDRVLKHMMHEIDSTLVYKTFFSRKMCLCNSMICELYKQSKILCQQLP